MAEGGKILWQILTHLKQMVQVGVTTLELDQEAERKILAAGAEPSFKRVPNYKFSTCLCVNEVVVHGLPGSYKLKKGDFLGIDVGIFYKGFNTDVAWTVVVGNKESRIMNHGKKKFLQAGKEALEKAICVAMEGNYVGNISQTIQETIEKAGYSVVRSLVGHGIGKKLHEDPQVPGFCNQAVTKTPRLKNGMTLAIEVIYNMGSPEVVYGDDGWTVVAEDGQTSGLFEKTVAITMTKPIVLTT